MLGLSKHFQPIERSGLKWDAGMILYEFDALREPEKTRFPLIGEYLKSLGIEFNEVKPKMLWLGEIAPDLYIANQLDAVPDWGPQEDFVETAISKTWKQSGPDDYTLDQASRIRHGDKFHDTFIEPMCEKILGIHTAEVAAKYHRSAWLPLYWPQTLRARQSLDTRFWYPKCGYAGIVAEKIGTGTPGNSKPFNRSEIRLTFVQAKPTKEFQVLFVVDKSPIYRVTDQDACAGLNPKFHRFVVESREYCQDPADELQMLGLCSSVQYSSTMSAFLPLPTVANVRQGWRPAPNLNDQLWEVMNATCSA